MGEAGKRGKRGSEGSDGSDGSDGSGSKYKEDVILSGAKIFSETSKIPRAARDDTVGHASLLPSLPRFYT